VVNLSNRWRVVKEHHIYLGCFALFYFVIFSLYCETLMLNLKVFVNAAKIYLPEQAMPNKTSFSPKQYRLSRTCITCRHYLADQHFKVLAPLIAFYGQAYLIVFNYIYYFICMSLLSVSNIRKRIRTLSYPIITAI
jgi:hypothetical protein